MVEDRLSPAKLKQALGVIARLCAVGVAALNAAAAHAQVLPAASTQGYPSKPIRMVTGEAGGGNDFAARLIAQALAVSLGQQVIVDNRSPFVAGEIVAKAPPDGYTLLLDSGSLWIRPLIRTMPIDPVRDFAPVSLAVISPYMLVVHPSLPANSVKELIALAKAKPGQLNYSAGPPGGAPHLSAELFKALAAVDIVRVSYRGAGPALIAVVGHEVQLMFTSLGSAITHVKAGRLRALAVTSSHPSALLPDLPPIASSVPGYETETIYAIFAPAKTPPQIVTRLSGEVAQAVKRADVKEKFFNAAATSIGSSPQQLAATMKSDMARMGKVIKDAGIREE